MDNAGASTYGTVDVSGAQILVVDDELFNLRFLERILRSEGYRNIVTVSDSREAAPLYHSQRFDAVLLDLKMPGMDGFQVMEEMKRGDSRGYLPVLVLTALDDMETRLRALKNGARDFLTKPVLREEVVARLRNLLEVRMLHNALHEHNRRLDAEVRERTRDLVDTRLEIIRRLGRAAEYRDNETGLHILRMSRYAQVLGRAADMSEADAETLLNASPMHDIGKIGIPDRILLKPGRLDAHEWEVMKTHTTMGAQILSGHPSELMEMARIVALTHHERWDGSGYPQGLIGDDIPLVGRIVAICDVFDALTTGRPYKQAWSVEDAVAYVRAHSGRRFDPALTARFVGLLPEVLAILAQSPEPAAA